MRLSRSAIALALLIAAACAPSTTMTVPPKVPTTPRKEGAILLASPGKGTVAHAVPGAPREFVRGRVRWHLENDGSATRLRAVTKEPTNVAFTLPPWLGNGIALVSESGLSAVDEAGNLRAVLRGPIASPSIGAHELWARARNTTSPDWIRIDVATGKATWSLSPIAAPILPTWSSFGTGQLAGRAITAGPEYLSPKVAFALVELLGPITSRDGGDTWGPLPREAVAAAFPNVVGPTRLVHEPAGVMLADELRLVPLSPTGQLGAPVMLSKGREIAPDVASIKIETALLQGVPIDSGNVLVADGGRFAVVSTDPIRVLRVTRTSDLTHCELRAEPATKDALAIAVCKRNDEGPSSAGAQLVVGAVLDGPSGLHLVPERVFSVPTAHRFSADGAVAFAGPCVGSEPGGTDVVNAARVCVRAAGGKYHEVAIGAIAGRVALSPRLDGGVLLVRIAASMMELAAMPPDATATTTPVRLAIDAEAVALHRELVTCVPRADGHPAAPCFEEISAGKFVLWRRVEKSLEPLTIELSLGKLRFRRGQSLPVGGPETYGIFGERALVATATTPKATTLMKLTTDAGATWAKADWPQDAAPLDGAPGIECRALGCLAFGWSRFGWQRSVASFDEVVSLDVAPDLPAPPARVQGTTFVDVKCKSASKPSPIDPAKVPVDQKAIAGKVAPVFGAPPKIAAGQALQTLPLRGAVNGAVFVWGPTSGPWADQSRVFVRFSSDLDPLGAVHETTPIASLFADRNAVQRVSNNTRAYPLGPGRAFLSFCEYVGHCDNAFFRAVAGMPLERINLSAVGAITKIANARELGGVLLVVGSAIPREKVTPVGKQMPEEQPFIALVSSTGTVTAELARSQDDAFATTDPVHGRFGVLVASALPTWLGGTTYALPIEATGLPSGAFEQLVAPSTEISRPSIACAATSSGWDRCEQNQTRTLRIEIDGQDSVTISSDAATIRARLTASGQCLDRWTQLGPRDAFQLDPASGHATLMSIAPDLKSATKQDLTCTLEWTPAL